MKFSPSTLGFYDSSIHSAIPLDAVNISESQYQELMALQYAGKTIVTGDDGMPTVINAFASQPNQCTPAQGLVALYALKQITEDNVLDAIAQIPDSVQQYTARIGYQRATSWERGSPTMLAMAQLLQLSDEDMDELFNYAVTVQV